jgi:hypothetical protein
VKQRPEPTARFGPALSSMSDVWASKQTMQSVGIGLKCFMANVELSNIFHCTQHNDIQQNDIQHNELQHNNIQHNDIQHNDIQHNDAQQKEHSA